MAAIDYSILESGFGNFFFAKKLKSKKNIMSQDRRLIEDNEIIAMFEGYLRKQCEENKNDTIEIKSGNKVIFEAKLIDMKNK